MIRIIANKKLDLNDDEFDYYQALEITFGKNCLSGLFKADKNGKILAITPDIKQPTMMALLFFLLNVTMNQKLRVIDLGVERIEKLENKLNELEMRMKNDDTK